MVTERYPQCPLIRAGSWPRYPTPVLHPRIRLISLENPDLLVSASCRYSVANVAHHFLLSYLRSAMRCLRSKCCFWKSCNLGSSAMCCAQIFSMSLSNASSFNRAMFPWLSSWYMSLRNCHMRFRWSQSPPINFADQSLPLPWPFERASL
jgi:hypothetical protein